MDARRDQKRRAWINQLFPGKDISITPASEDASFRSYWRLRVGPDETCVLMDAPPDKEDCRPFVDVARRLRAIGLHAPEIIASDLNAGFLLLEDLGDTLYADDLAPGNADALYGEALDALSRMLAIDPAGLPDYDRTLLCEEMNLFPEWYVARQLGRPTDGMDWWQSLTDWLVTAALDQPQVFVHRDYHCGNLMRCENPPGIIDFQDAVRGPITYDIVSLLMDRYITWPRARISAWSEQYRRRVGPDIAPADWQRWFDLMSLQRNLKVVGIFARLNLRDGKPRYLAWQPRFISYLRDTSGRYPECAALACYLDQAAS